MRLWRRIVAWFQLGRERRAVRRIMAELHAAGIVVCDDIPPSLFGYEWVGSERMSAAQMTRLRQHRGKRVPVFHVVELKRDS